MKSIYKQISRLEPVTLIPFFLLNSFTSYASPQQEAVLTIQLQNETRIFKRSELMKRSDLEKIELKDSPTYPEKKVLFSAVPLHHLFGPIPLPEDSNILFHCQDGFSAPISAQRLLNDTHDHAIAYLAIEDLKHPWPKINVGNKLQSTGPFYLIWKNATASQIKTEEWPFQVTRFEVKPSLRTSYPKLYPQGEFKTNHPVMRGLKIFTQNCFTCHTINLQGDSHFGPDLNTPYSPTEYFHEEYLKKFIRNPQSIRHWREDRMKGFQTSEISDDDLDDLISYLKEMSKSRKH